MRKARLGLQGIEREAERLRTLLGISPDLISPFLALPMLRGLWVASVDSGGGWYDISGHGHHLSYQGNPTFNYAGPASYWNYDGTGDYHNRADEADLDILGNESYVAAAAQGLTMGGWFWMDAFPGAGGDGLIGKWNRVGVTQSSYLLEVRSTQAIRFALDNVGAIKTTDTTFTVSSGQWYFIAGIWDPGTLMTIRVNDQIHTDAVAVPAAPLRNSTADFEIGAYNVGANLLDGRAACCFLCAAACSDTQISNVFQQSKVALGV